jgi:large subunit ribosomal protein L37Ae
MTTRKLKSAARFGSRYGKKIRERVLKVEREQHAKRKCPHCRTGILKRQAAGLYACVKCGAQMAGGAYQPQTLQGSLVTRMIAQKGAATKALQAELEAATKRAKGAKDAQEVEAKAHEPKKEEPEESPAMESPSEADDTPTEAE